MLLYYVAGSLVSDVASLVVAETIAIFLHRPAAAVLYLNMSSYSCCVAILDLQRSEKVPLQRCFYPQKLTPTDVPRARRQPMKSSLN